MLKPRLGCYGRHSHDPCRRSTTICRWGAEEHKSLNYVEALVEAYINEQVIAVATKRFRGRLGHFDWLAALYKTQTSSHHSRSGIRGYNIQNPDLAVQLVEYQYGPT